MICLEVGGVLKDVRDWCKDYRPPWTTLLRIIIKMRAERKKQSKREREERKWECDRKAPCWHAQCVRVYHSDYLPNATEGVRGRMERKKEEEKHHATHWSITSWVGFIFNCLSIRKIHNNYGFLLAANKQNVLMEQHWYGHFWQVFFK